MSISRPQNFDLTIFSLGGKVSQLISNFLNFNNVQAITVKLCHIF